MKKIILVSISLIPVSVLLAGIIKFNILQDDLYLEPTPEAMVGAWLEMEPVPGRQGMYQGFELSADGRAQSINMATLLYRRWEMSGDKITFQVKSIGNGITLQDEEHYTVQSLRLDLSRMTLVSPENRVFHYIKEDPAMRAQNERF